MCPPATVSTKSRKFAIGGGNTAVEEALARMNIASKVSQLGTPRQI
jgi:thioredoxin reductase